VSDQLCTTCNWHPHDLAVHGKLCINGHPVAIVGRYGNGVCRVCQRAMSKRYDERHRERARARWRAWWARTHTSPEGAGRDNPVNTGGRSVAGPGAAVGAYARPAAPTNLRGEKP